MKRVIFLLIFLLQFNIVFASGEDNTSKYIDELNSGEENYSEELDYSGEENYSAEIDYSGEDIYSDDINNQTDVNSNSKTFKGKVITAGKRYEEPDIWSNDKVPYQDVRIKIDEDGYSDIVLVKYQLTFYLGSTIPADELKVGDTVYVTVLFDENGKATDAYIEYISNENFLIAMVAIYAGAIVLIGGFKGFKALVGLIITILAMFFVMVPLIFDGYPPLLVTVITCVLVTVITFIIVSGFSKKTVAATIGTAGGIIVAGIFAMIFGNLMKLTGACTHSLELSMIEGGSRFDFESIMISGIIVGALGACMDVGMSIASSLHELSVEGNGMTVRKLIKSGMNIGKDVMGTMTNTLILAYVGSSLLVILLLKGYNFEPYQIFNNTELVVEEVLRAIAGSFGLIFTIPITTFVSSLLMGKRDYNIEELVENQYKDKEEAFNNEQK